MIRQKWRDGNVSYRQSYKRMGRLGNPSVSRKVARGDTCFHSKKNLITEEGNFGCWTIERSWWGGRLGQLRLEGGTKGGVPGTSVGTKRCPAHGVDIPTYQKDIVL